MPFDRPEMCSLDYEHGGVSMARGQRDEASKAAMTAQLTTLTHTAAGTPDYAIANLTTTTPYGFVAQDEGNTVLAVIANLQVRMAEVEAALEALKVVLEN